MSWATCLASIRFGPIPISQASPSIITRAAFGLARHRARTSDEVLNSDGTLTAITDYDYLMGNVRGGEGYAWYYAGPADRFPQTRTPITDGAYGNPGFSGIRTFGAGGRTTWRSRVECASPPRAAPAGCRARGRPGACLGADPRRIAQVGSNLRGWKGVLWRGPVLPRRGGLATKPARRGAVSLSDYAFRAERGDFRGVHSEHLAQHLVGMSRRAPAG